MRPCQARPRISFLTGVFLVVGIVLTGRLLAAPNSAGIGGAPPAMSSKLPSAQTPDAGGTAPVTGSSAFAGTIAPRRNVPKPRAPSAQQIQALKQLSDEAKVYAEGAKNFRRTLTMIVRHHYEEHRRRVLAVLDKEIGSEKTNLAVARDNAIRRLEAFVERYSGPNADPTATPDAMFRLAALYEERARSASEGDVGQLLNLQLPCIERLHESTHPTKKLQPCTIT